MAVDQIGALSHILWIGGATDAGKSTVADRLAQRHHLQVYHYDRRDVPHHEQLAAANPVYRALLDATLDERWVQVDPPALLQQTLRSFRDRFPLMVRDLLAWPADRCIVAEGFGLLPELLAPVLAAPAQAIWLVPTAEFKQASVTRRGKPSFGPQVSDPAKARANLLGRDHLLTDYLKAQVTQYGYTLYEVDGTRSPDEVADVLERHFGAWLNPDFTPVSHLATPGRQAAGE